MPGTKLYSLLQTLSARELKELDTFLRSGLYKVPPRVLEAWKSTASPVLDKSRPAQKDWQMLQENDEAMDRKVRSELLGSIVDYLTFSAFRKEKGISDSLLAKAINDRSLDEFFPSTIHKLLDAQQRKSPEDWHGQLRLQEERMVFESRQPSRAPIEALPEIHATLDEYFILKKLKYICASFNQGKIISQSGLTGITWVQIIRSYFTLLEQQEQHRKLDPLTWMYFFALQILDDSVSKKEQEAYLHKLLGILRQNRASYDQDEVLDLYLHCQNYCIRQINLYDSSQHTGILAETYTALLDAGVILNAEGRLSPLHFKNIAITMTRKGAFDWVDDFVARYADDLDRDPKGLGRLFAEGLLSYYKGDLSRAYARFDRVIGESEDVFFGLDSRIYQLKIDFERRAEDAHFFANFSNAERAYRLALKRRKPLLSPGHFKNYLLFGKLYLQLSKAAAEAPGQKRDRLLQQLRQRLEEEQAVVNQHWFEAMLKALHSESRGR